MRCSYVVPITGADLVALIRRAVFRTRRLVLTALTEKSAHIGYRAVAGIGYETIVLGLLDQGDGTTLIDGRDRGVIGTVNTLPHSLPALFDSIVAELDELDGEAGTG
ncbi:MAG TPA: hypothetical protein VJR25_01025 [Microbacterium sp.]|nr:hypothetical protein [Microbacterium sp.]